MATWSLTAAGAGAESITLDSAPWWLEWATGIGGPPVRRLTQRGPMQHGQTDVGFRLDARSIMLGLACAAETAAAADGYRDTLQRVLGPGVGRPVYLRCVRDDGETRQIDCYALNMVDAPARKPERIGGMQRFAVQLVAHDPAWYDPAPMQVSAGLASISSGMLVPVEVPLLIESGSGADGRVQMHYSGTWDEYPILTLVGPIKDALIANETTGDTLSFEGYTIAAGDSITVDLRYGYKTVIEDDGTNRIDKLTSDSDLATWRLASILETGDGVNVLRLSGSSLTAASAVTMIYHARYISL